MKGTVKVTKNYLFYFGKTGAVSSYTLLSEKAEYKLCDLHHTKQLVTCGKNTWILYLYNGNINYDHLVGLDYHLL